MLKQVYFTVAFSVFGILFLASHRLAAADVVSHEAVLAPFVNDDTLAAAYVDVASLNAANIGEMVSALPKLPDTAQAQMVGAMMFSGLVKSFQDAGGQGVYVVVGLGDLNFNGGPLVIATTTQGKNSQDLEQRIRETIRLLPGQSSQASGKPADEIEVQRKGKEVLIGRKQTMARYNRFRSSPRSELISPLANLSSEGAVVAIVFCPGSDYRRVSRELWPELPGPLAPLRGDLADRWIDFEAAINLPPNIKPRIALQAKDADSAAVFVKLFRDLPAAAESIKEFGTVPAELKQMARILVDATPQQQDGARVTLSPALDQDQINKLLRLMTGANGLAMESSRRRHRMDQFKQLALAMYLYENVHKSLPAAAMRDKEGKPLLSWRVAILPFLENDALYKQFHLDEPWDSPHNRTLIEKMPAVFADPDPRSKNQTREGKTTIQLPVGPDTIFYKNEGTRFQEIKDGASATIMIVDVEPQRAVVWTKPDDWNVDMSNPGNGVEETIHKVFAAAYADGHVALVDPKKTGDKTLKAELTRAGHEVIDQ